MKNKLPVVILLSLFSYIVFAASTAVAQWLSDPTVNTPIATGTNFEFPRAIVSDGDGGAIIAWENTPDGIHNNHIYAQRINSAGVSQWTTNGVPVSTASGAQTWTTAVSDGSGGAIIAWEDRRNGALDIYAQHINSSGVRQWIVSGDSNGVPVSAAVNDQAAPSIISDGSGGAIIAWADIRSGTNSDVYAQRINSSGVRQWIVSGDSNGVPVAVAVNNQSISKIVSDGSGGAIIVWDDNRTGTWVPYAQRINSSGVTQWTANGVRVSASLDLQEYSTAVSDGSGGAIIVWENEWNNQDLYAQRINSSGVTQWTANGVPVSTAAGLQTNPTAVSDGSGGAIIAWRDFRNGLNNAKIYLQRINSSGVRQWIVSGDSNGVPVALTIGTQVLPVQEPFHVLVSDGSGGAIITWYDNRDSSTSASDVYAQRFDGGGISKWTASGVPVSTAVNDQFAPIIVGDDAGGAIITWYDMRSGTNSDVYAQNVKSNGTLGLAGPSNFAYHFAEGWNMMSVPLAVSDYKKSILFPSAISNAFAYQGGYVTVDSLINGKGYWLKFPSADSVSISGSPITAETVVVNNHWNIIGSISSPVPASTVSSIPPSIITSNFFGYSNAYYVADTLYPGMGYWIKVAQNGSLILSNGLSSASLNKIRIVPTSELPPPPPWSAPLVKADIPSSFALDQNYPNPFNPNTTIRYALPENTHVKLLVYDLLSREVLKLVDENQGAGYKTVSFNTTNLPSGVYFYRLQARNFIQVKKMVLAK